MQCTFYIFIYLFELSVYFFHFPFYIAMHRAFNTKVIKNTDFTRRKKSQNTVQLKKKQKITINPIVWSPPWLSIIPESIFGGQVAGMVGGCPGHCWLLYSAHYTEPRRVWKWKIKINFCSLVPLWPLKQIPNIIFVPGLCLPPLLPAMRKVVGYFKTFNSGRFVYYFFFLGGLKIFLYT